MLRIEEILDKRHKEKQMKGYIKRLSQDIEKLDAKRQAIVLFLENPREPINDKQQELLRNQEELMWKLLDVMKLRLANERELHPDYFEDLPEVDNCDEQEATEE